MGTSLLELLQQLSIENGYPFLAAYVNNRIKELNYKIYKPIVVRFIDITHFEGYRVYQRTISFILQKAAADIFPERKLYIRHSLGRGLYGEFADSEELSVEDIEALRQAMQQIINTGYTISRQRMLSSEINEIFKAKGFDDKVALLNSRKRLYSNIHTMDDAVGYFYGALTPDTSYIHLFDIRRYYNGFYIALPLRSNPSTLDLNGHLDKMFDVFREYGMWVKIMGVPTVGHLN